jgi:hypothetical protein
MRRCALSPDQEAELDLSSYERHELDAVLSDERIALAAKVVAGESLFNVDGLIHHPGCRAAAVGDLVGRVGGQRGVPAPGSARTPHSPLRRESSHPKSTSHPPELGHVAPDFRGRIALTCDVVVD